MAGVQARYPLRCPHDRPRDRPGATDPSGRSSPHSATTCPPLSRTADLLLRSPVPQSAADHDLVRRLHKVGELLAVLEEPTPQMQTVRSPLSAKGSTPSRRTFERRLKALPETLPE